MNLKSCFSTSIPKSHRGIIYKKEFFMIKIKMIKIIIIPSLGVASYFISSSENDTLKYIVYTATAVGVIAAIFKGLVDRR